MGPYIVVTTTVDSEEGARELGKRLVESYLAACVQVVGPISSTYRWKGRVETAQEWLCLVKTRQDLYDRVEAAIGEEHPYEVPEIVALAISQGSKDYLSWLDDVVR
jgi:periplasmic divalent cation tolerance protein